jgi:TolA-binding protein
MRLLPIWTLALAGLLLTTWPAAAQMSREDIALRNQIYELQQQVQALQQQMASQGRGGGGGGGSYLGRQGGYAAPQSGGGGGEMVAQLLARVQTLEEQVRELRGRIDETQNQVQQQGTDFSKRLDDLRFQMGGGTGGAPTDAAPPAGPGAAAGAAAGPTLSPPPRPLGSTQAPSAPPPPPAAPVRRTPEVAIQEGNAALARRDYPAAETAAREVLNNYRTSPRAYDAQYLLGQALTGERQYSQAAIAYDDTYNRNRKGARAPEALVGLANSLSAINEKRAACETLAKLHAEFPQQKPDVREAAAAVQQRAGCH